MPLIVVLAVATAVSVFHLPWGCIVSVPGLLFVLWFFRDPERISPASERTLLSPADGRIVEIAAADEPDHIARRAAKIAIFMSVFDVHVNRSPCKAKVEWVRHVPGSFMNAFRPRASIENERALVALRDQAERPVLLKLVAGLIARRIVCPLRPGDALEQGQRLGMIKFGSRVEVLVPADEGFQVTVKLGQRVRAGQSVLGEWR